MFSNILFSFLTIFKIRYQLLRIFLILLSLYVSFYINFFLKKNNFLNSTLKKVKSVNPLQPRQPYLAPNFEYRYFKNYNKLINCVFFLNINSIVIFSKKMLEAKKNKDTHFIGARVGCLKINSNSDQKIFFQKMSIFIFSINLNPKSYQNDFHMLISIFSYSFQKHFI